MIRRQSSTIAAVLLTALLCTPAANAAQPLHQLEAARKRLVDQVLVPAGISDAWVLESLRTTPRHEFVSRALWHLAYEDMALPIGAQQTISSPFIVAHMTEVLQPQPTDRVLEIGTGSGYQAAILSPLVDQVYTIEIVESLGDQARGTLDRLGYDNVFVRVGDGFLGWPEAAPFDKIIVTCSPERVPQPLVDQLKEGGRMVIPVGQRYQQTLTLMEKRDGELHQKALEPTLFVPMTGAAEQERQAKPDPANPKIVGGDFDAVEEPGVSLGGWYYGRQVERLAEDGNGFVRFKNQTPGLGAHLLQGMAIDGSVVNNVRLSGRVRTASAVAGSNADEFPALAITFYDELRREVATYWIGPLLGSRNWTQIQKIFPVPSTTREAIVRIGLFGATGTADFDDIAIAPR